MQGGPDRRLIRVALGASAARSEGGADNPAGCSAGCTAQLRSPAPAVSRSGCAELTIDTGWAVRLGGACKLECTADFGRAARRALHSDSVPHVLRAAFSASRKDALPLAELVLRRNF